MKISDHDLRQLDAESLQALLDQDHQALLHLTIDLADDLKLARERLNQNSQNSSRPPSSREPWSRLEAGDEDDSPPPSPPPPAADDQPASESEKPKDEEKKGKGKKRPVERRRAGKQPGAPGHARTQQLPVTHTQHHYPSRCLRCGAELPPDQAVCYAGFQVLDVEFGDDQHPGLQATNTQHFYYETPCSCGHHNRCEPRRTPPEGGDWGKVAISEWRLIGPGMAALLLILHFRMRLSVRYCREFMIEVFGIHLADGTITRSLHESARAAAPVADQIRQQVRDSDLAYADETPHKQAGDFLWLWVFANAYTVAYAIGRRTKEMFLGAIGLEFAGWLMSDGYLAYRHYAQRLRCWAHLIRKARALAETYTPHVQGYGKTLLETFDLLIEAIQKAREGPPADLTTTLAKELEQLRQLCEKMSRSANAKAAKLGREFLNDWEAIFRVLEHPHMPLTNNFAERMLRHWVILRRITQGTRTSVGSLALTTVASVVETCRLRKASPLRYLQQVIAASRKGLDVPPLPPIPVAP